MERDPEPGHAEALEDTAAYERAVEDGTVQAPAEQQDPGAGEQAPHFQEPE